MNKNEIVTTIPTWDECHAKHENEEKLDPVELFIRNNEPTQEAGSEEWRKEFVDALDHAMVEGV